MELHDGDCTFQKSFNKVVFTVNGKITGGFKSPKGKQFVVVLIGTADKNADDFDTEAALNQLGFFRKELTTLANVTPPRDLRTQLPKEADHA